MKAVSLFIILLTLAACSTQPEPLSAEQYVYYDECMFVQDYVDVDCREYAVRASNTQAWDEQCYFSDKECLEASAEVRLTDIYITAEFSEEISQAQIDFKGLQRECSVSDTTVRCSIPIIQIDRDYKQPFSLTVDGEVGKLLIYV